MPPTYHVLAYAAVTQVGVLREESLEEAKRLLGRAYPYDRAAIVAEEKLFGGWPGGHPGETLGAWIDGRLAGVAAWAGRWLRVLAVDPAARKNGVGTALLDEVIGRARAAGATRLRAADQAGNYLAPGVDARDDETIAWLQRRGFVPGPTYENLRVSLKDNPLVSEARAAEAAAACAGYTIRRATAEDRAPLRAMVGIRFAPAWAHEVDRGDVHVAVEDASGKLVAFAAHDGNNRGLGWFGPAGTLEEHRGKGLGAALLLPCLLDVAAAGHDTGVIAWIGPRAFYEKTAGAVTDRRFVVMIKESL